MHLRVVREKSKQSGKKYAHYTDSIDFFMKFF